MIPLTLVLQSQFCGDLFPRDRVAAREKYHEYAKRIHPDVCHDPSAEEAMNKLTRLYQEALRCLDDNTWQMRDVDFLTTQNGGSLSVAYLIKTPFEQGVRYVCKTSVLWLFADPACASRFQQGVSRISYRDSKMSGQFKPFMPQITKTFSLQDGSFAIVVAKTPDQYPLDLVLQNAPEAITDRHLAWVTSRLCNLCCFLSFNQLSHNGLTPPNLFLSAKDHTLSILGGWQYAAAFGKKMKGVPRAVYDIMPLPVKASKTGSPLTDLESVKLIGRTVGKTAALPKPLASFYQSGSSPSAVQEFNKWSRTLDQAYGKRMFVPLTLTNNQVYQKEK